MQRRNTVNKGDKDALAPPSKRPSGAVTRNSEVKPFKADNNDTQSFVVQSDELLI